MNLLGALKTTALMNVPASVAPENQYAKSFAAVLCLAVSADLVFDVDEFTQASRFIEQDQSLRELGLTRRTVEFFKAYCDAIQKVMNQGNIDFPALQTDMIAEVRDIPDAYKMRVQALIQQLRSACNAQEQAVLDRIDL